MNDLPDAVLAYAVVCLFADAPTTIRNVANLRIKETDRLAAMACELRKLGASVDEGEDFLRITPPQQWRGASIATYDDHRMAMCFSLASLSGALRDGTQVRINDPQCVAKTFPDYFDAFAAICAA
jgi:3-phosphoshikimate 1-carboxyvinyltransferase